MVVAYSRLRRVLTDQNLTIPELHRRILERGGRVNLKSLYRLNNEQQPLERLDLRLAGAICQVCQVMLSELISFETPQTKLRRFPAAKQKRLDVLMAKNNDGRLTRAERDELQLLAREAEELALDNARKLAQQRRQLTGR